MKKFVAGIIVSCVLISTGTAFAESVTKTIEAKFGQVKLVVNGENVEKETLLYNGTTYLPLRDTADALNMDVGWDEKTNTASLNDKVEATKVEVAIPSPKPEVTQKTEIKQETPATIDQFPVTFTILPPNSIDTIWLNATYQNNSAYSVRDFNIKYRDVSTNEIHYLSSKVTILKNGNSPVFDGFGPISGKESDLEMIETNFILIKEGGTMSVSYDHKSKTYELGDWKK